MRLTSLFVAALALLSTAASPAQSVSSTKGPAGIHRASWLAGCWQAQRGQDTVEEQWMRPLGGSMLGMSRTVRGGALAEYELIVLREQGDRLTYQAHPSGQPSALFTSVTIGDDRVVFENLQHDFPQRIGYDRKGANVTAWIEGPRGGQVRRIEFPYVSAPCRAE